MRPYGGPISLFSFKGELPITRCAADMLQIVWVSLARGPMRPRAHWPLCPRAYGPIAYWTSGILAILDKWVFGNLQDKIAFLQSLEQDGILAIGDKAELVANLDQTDILDHF